MSHLRHTAGQICNVVMAAQGWALTSQVHPGLETLPYSARRTVFPADLVDDAVVPPGAQVVVLTYREAAEANQTCSQAR